MNPKIQIRHRLPPPWQSRAVATTRPGISTHREYQVGDAWHAYKVNGHWTMYGDGPLNTRDKLVIAEEHIASKVNPVIVVLPSEQHLSGYPFCVHSPVIVDGVFGTKGWTVTGDIYSDPPTLSVSPSINVAGVWHGFIIDGWLR